jgi:lysophospholipase L1-like esterase
MPTVALIGDSIRMGYQPMVCQALAGRADVWGPEINGSHTVNVLAHLHDWVVRRRPDVLHINAGLHDLKTATTDLRDQIVPPEHYRRNVELILRVAASCSRHVIWATTTPVREQLHNARRSADGSFLRYQQDVEVYNEIAVRAAAAGGAEINDLHDAAVRAGLDRIQEDDGVHFTEDGSGLLARAVCAAIEPLLP